MSVMLKEEVTHLTVVFAEDKISTLWLRSFHNVLDFIERDYKHKIVVFRSQCDTFCSGMDVTLISDMHEDERRAFFNEYVRMLIRVVEIDKFCISLVNGNVFGGGLGLLSSMDFVLAGRNHCFCLPEALLGIIPACIFPFLVRRIGHQAACRLSLTTQKINVEQAVRIALVDQVSDDLESSLRTIINRMKYIDREIIVEMKKYFNGSNKINQRLLDDAINRIVRLSGEQLFLDKVNNYFV